MAQTHRVVGKSRQQPKERRFFKIQMPLQQSTLQDTIVQLPWRTLIESPI